MVGEYEEKVGGIGFRFCLYHQNYGYCGDLKRHGGIDSMNPKWEDFPPIKIMVSDIYKFGHFLKNVGK